MYDFISHLSRIYGSTRGLHNLLETIDVSGKSGKATLESILCRS